MGDTVINCPLDPRLKTGVYARFSITGWSSLRVALRNELEEAVTVRFRVDVKGVEQMDRELGLDPGERRQLELAVDVPYGATVRYHATLLDTGNAAETAFEASAPLWGGNKCSFEAVATVDDDGVSLGPRKEIPLRCYQADQAVVFVSRPKTRLMSIANAVSPSWSSFLCR